MEKFTVYEQRALIQLKDGYKPNVVYVGEVQALSLKEAFEKAKKEHHINHPLLWSKSIEKIVREANQRG